MVPGAAALSEVRLCGKHKGPRKQRRENWCRVNECHWAQEAAAVATGWLYGSINCFMGSTRPMLSLFITDHVPVWLQENPRVVHN